jgi:hypothetical protein
LVLVASTRSSRPPLLYSARVIVTVSDVVGVGVRVGVFVAVEAAVGVRVGVFVGTAVGVDTPVGRTVSVVDLVTPAPDTEMVTVVAVSTGEVFTKKPPANAHCGTWTISGTLATAGLLLDRKR